MTREEAIETIRRCCPKISNSECDFETAMRFLIPELAESEDEKIRKWLVDYFKEVGKSWIHRDISPERIVAYLEKQKENPKTADSISPDCTPDAKCGNRDSGYGVFPEDALVVARACEKLEAHGYLELAHALINVNLYTKEQKPAEWSDEDEKYLNRVINLWVNDFGEDSDTVKWLKSLRPSWKPSEEQMKALESCGQCNKQVYSLYLDLKKL